MWITIPLVTIAWLCLGVQIADATPTLEVGAPASAVSRTAATEYEASSTQATMVYLECHNAVFGTTSLKFAIVIGGVGVVGEEWANESTKNTTHEVSFIVPAGKKWEYVGTAAGTMLCQSVYQELKATIVAGPEGKEGKEGKPGVEGKEGPKGETGAAGPSTKDEVTSFGPTAEGTISEALEHVEALFFAIIGTMLAMAVAMMAYKLTHS